MMSQDEWTGRVLDVEFINEDPPKGKGTKTRRFTNIRRDATEDQILQFSAAVSKLTPNRIGNDVLADVYDHFVIDQL